LSAPGAACDSSYLIASVISRRRLAYSSASGLIVAYSAASWSRRDSGCGWTCAGGAGGWVVVISSYSKSLIRVTQYGRVWPSWQAISGQTWVGTGHALRRLALAPRVLGVRQRVRLPAAPAGLATTAVPVVGRVGAAGLELARLPGLAPVLGDRARVRLAAGLTGVGGVGGLDVALGQQLVPQPQVATVGRGSAAGLELVRHQAVTPASGRSSGAAEAGSS